MAEEAAGTALAPLQSGPRAVSTQDALSAAALRYARQAPAPAFRRAELVMIRVADLSFGPHGLSVLLPRSKADQEGAGVSVHVAANPLTAHCPVAALRAWLHAAGIRDRWVFRRISRSDAVGRH